MKNISIKIVSLLFAAGLIIGCEKNVDIDIDEIETMLVMNGLLSADSAVDIYITRTRHILDNMDINVLTGVKVRIYDESGNSDSLVYGSGQLYHSNNIHTGEGKTYRITAEMEGMESVEASCTIPYKVPLKKVDTSGIVDEWGNRQISFEIIFDDPPGEDNYYMFSIGSDKVTQYIDYFYELDTLYVDIEKDTVVIGYRRDSIVNIYGVNENIWFSSEDLAVDQWDYQSGRIVFSDKLFDGKTYSLNGSFDTYFLYDASDSVTIYMNLHTINYDYYKYLDTRQDHYYAKDDLFAVPVVVHNNIENGLGILGGMSVATDSFKMAPMRYDYWYYGYEK